jgi:glycerol kinase
MDQPTVMAIDQGTSGTTVMLFDQEGQALYRAYREVTQHYPQPGWVEHDPEQIMMGVVDAIGEVLSHSKAWPRAIGITNQRETIVVWDKRTGRAVHNAIVWQCRRTATDCERLRADGVEDMIRQKTGLLLDPYFSATKLSWLLRQRPELAGAAARGELLAGTIDTWLAWCLTGSHVTDVSNASRTMLLNVHTLNWDQQLLDLFGIPRELLPAVVDTSGVIGVTGRASDLPAGIPVASLVGDQQAALYGQTCFRPGMAKCTYGTGAFLLMHCGTQPVAPPPGLLSTVAWRYGGRAYYCLEGSVFVAGAAVRWLRDGLGLIASADETESLARLVPDTGGVVFVPAFAGLGAPYWDPAARGVIIGITAGTRREHVVRACLEAIAQQCHDVLESMVAETGDLQMLRVDGGAARNDFLLQTQADLSGVEVHRPVVAETTALGAAMLAGLATGVWRDEAELQSVWHADAVFRPTWSDSQRHVARANWLRAVASARQAAGGNP